MRFKSLLAAAAAIALVGLANPDTASAFDRDHPPAGWGSTREISHHVYYPRYRHHYHVDPYAYRHSPRGYYPYYASHYWRSTDTIKSRNHKHYHHWNVQAPRYKYHSSWGYPKHWDGHEHSHESHGRHHSWHW